MYENSNSSFPLARKNLSVQPGLKMFIGFDTFVEPANVAKISYFYRKINFSLATYIRKHMKFGVATDDSLFVIGPTFDLLFTW